MNEIEIGESWRTKYILHQVDGSPVEVNADYLILRLDEPENVCERVAAWHYATCLEAANDELAGHHLKNRIQEHERRLANELGDYIGWQIDEQL